MADSLFCIATLISDPNRPCIDGGLLAAVARRIDGPEPRVLRDGIAAEVSFATRDPAEAENAVRDAVGDRPVDIVVQAAAGRRKRLLLADMDSTMIGQECIDELADLVGLKAAVSAITERAMQGEIAFEPALRERVALLKGLPVEVIDTILAERITLTPGGRTLVATMRAHGAYACLVSGGFTAFTAAVGRAIGFDEDRANRLLLAEDRLAGLVEEPILGREAKLATLVELRERFGLARADVMAVGDGANDLAMLGGAGLGVAFRAKPAVAAAAHARVDHGDLTALLYMQGYAAADFVDPPA
jgi:phosphoserine phosphatase